MVSNIQIARLLAHCVLLGSIAKLLLAFPCGVCWHFLQMVDAITGKVMSSMVIVLALKSIAIPYSFIVLHQEQGNVVAYYPCRTRLHQVLTRTFCYQSLVVLNHIRF
jgi:hypothetical protein